MSPSRLRMLARIETGRDTYSIKVPKWGKSRDVWGRKFPSQTGMRERFLEENKVLKRISEKKIENFPKNEKIHLIKPSSKGKVFVRKKREWTFFVKSSTMEIPGHSRKGARER